MKVSDMIERLPIDQSAQTIKEIRADKLMSPSWTDRFVRSLIAEGRVEKVLKKVNGRMVPAYRPKKK